ncbi:hypothetical protein [Halocola ammonii]
MTDYTIIYKDGKTEQLECAGKKELIEILFDGQEKSFKDKVSSLKWSTISMRYIEDVETGKIDSEITSADVNPYGWRDH